MKAIKILFLVLLLSVNSHAHANYNDNKIPMSLSECIEMALSQSTQLKIKRSELELSELELEKEISIFDPVIWSNAKSVRGNSRAISILDGVEFNKQDRLFMDLGVTKQFDIGTKFDIWTKTNYIDTNIVTQIYNPMFNSEFMVALRQPILSGAGKISTEYKIELAKINIRIQTNEYKDMLNEVKSDVKKAYLKFAYCYDNMRIASEMLVIAKSIREIARHKLEAGELSRVDLSRFEESVLGEEVTYLEIVKMFNESEILLKRSMNNHMSKSRFIPYDEYKPLTINYTVDYAYQNGLNRNHEYYRQQKEIEKKKISLRAAKAGNKPVLNAVLEAGINGTEHTFADSYSKMGNAGQHSWTIGLEFAVPVGNREAESIYKEAVIDLSKEQLKLDNFENDFYSDIAVRVNQILSFNDKIEKMYKLDTLANARLKAIEVKFRRGMASNSDILDILYEMKKIKTELSKMIFENNLAVIEINRLIGEEND